MGLFSQARLKAPAADLAAQDGKDWGELDDKEKELYLNKAKQQAEDSRNTSPMGR